MISPTSTLARTAIPSSFIDLTRIPETNAVAVVLTRVHPNPIRADCCLFNLNNFFFNNFPRPTMLCGFLISFDIVFVVDNGVVFDGFDVSPRFDRRDDTFLLVLDDNDTDDIDDIDDLRELNFGEVVNEVGNEYGADGIDSRRFWRKRLLLWDEVRDKVVLLVVFFENGDIIDLFPGVVHFTALPEVIFRGGLDLILRGVPETLPLGI